MSCATHLSQSSQPRSFSTSRKNSWGLNTTGTDPRKKITESQHKELIIAHKEQNKHVVISQENPEKKNTLQNFTGQLHCRFTHSPHYKSIMLCYKILHGQLMLLSNQGLICGKDLFGFSQPVSKLVCSLSVSMLWQPELYCRPAPHLGDEKKRMHKQCPSLQSSALIQINFLPWWQGSWGSSCLCLPHLCPYAREAVENGIARKDGSRVTPSRLCNCRREGRRKKRHRWREWEHRKEELAFLCCVWASNLALCLVSLLLWADQENPVNWGAALELGWAFRICSNSMAIFDL